jgi:hypothetical protein
LPNDLAQRSPAKLQSITGVQVQSMSFLTLDESRAIVAGNAASHHQRRHGYVLDNKHMYSHIQAIIGRAASVTKAAIISS